MAVADIEIAIKLVFHRVFPVVDIVGARTSLLVAHLDNQPIVHILILYSQAIQAERV